jgi:hypothetical protein
MNKPRTKKQLFNHMHQPRLLLLLLQVDPQLTKDAETDIDALIKELP